MSVDFDPVRLRPNRRRIDPVVMAVMVVVLGIAAAVIKPWEDRRPADVPVPSAAPAVAVARALASARPAAIVPRSFQAPGPPPLTWSDLAPAVVGREVWGVAAVILGPPAATDAPPATGYLERWSPAVADGSGADSALIAGDDQSIVALGVTVPSGEIADDARIWRLHDDGGLEWIDADPVGGRDVSGTLLLVQPGNGGAAFTSWAGGHYRIDILAGDGIHRIALQVPGRFGNIPAPDPWPTAPADLVAARTGDPSVTRQGPFAVVDGVSVGLSATAGPLLDEAAEWRAELDRARAKAAPVAVVHLPRATGLGVMFTEHAVVDSAGIRRLAPDHTLDAAPAFGGVSSLHGRTPFLVFTPNGGGAWEPGVYAISATWNDPAGAHSGTWHIELRPGALAGGPGAATGPGNGG